MKSAPLPINAMAGPGAPSIADLERVGVRRVSLGTVLAQAAYGIIRRVAAEAPEKGTFEALACAPSTATSIPPSHDERNWSHV